MAEQPIPPVFDRAEALRVLEEAWAYFTPSPPQQLPASAYDDLPTAA